MATNTHLHASAHSIPTIRTTIRDVFAIGPSYTRAIVVIITLSMMLRLFLVLSANPILTSDAYDYHEYAVSLLNGHGYSQTYQGDSHIYNGFTFRAYRSPGYPVLLASLYSVFGPNVRAAMFVNIFADFMTQACVVLIAFRLFGAMVAMAAAVLLGIHVLWTPNPMTESVYTAIFSLLLLMLVHRTIHHSIGAAAAFGVLIAIALFIRPITICLVPILGWRFLFQGFGKRQIAAITLVALPSLAATGCWTYRNYLIFERPVFLTTNLGPLNARDYGLDRDMEFKFMRKRGLNEAEINAAFLRAEAQRAAEKPWEWGIMVSRRMADLFSLYPTWELQVALWRNILPIGPHGSFAGRLHYALYYPHYITYPLAAIGGCVLLMRRRQVNDLWVVLVSYVVLHGLLSRGDIRYLAPIYPIMCIFAGVAICECVAAVTSKGLRRLSGREVNAAEAN